MKQVKDQIPVWICCVLMFVWIFVTVFLTGGREISDFTRQDFIIFAVFIGVEILTVGIMCFFLIRMIRKTEKAIAAAQIELGKNEIEKKKRGNVLLAIAFVLMFCFLTAGIIAGDYSDLKNAISWKVIHGLCVILPIGSLVLSVFLTKRYLKKLEQMKVEEGQRYIVSHREAAEDVAEQKLNFIKKCRFLADVYAVILAVSGACNAFFAGALYDVNVAVILYFVSVIFFQAALSRIRFSVLKEFFEDDKTYVSEEQFPEIYALARSAADRLKCTGEIKIALLDDFNAGIAKVEEVYSVQLGVVLVNLLSKEELYSVLLHEFAHIANDTKSVDRERMYYFWLTSGTNPHYLSGITSLFFSYIDMLYSFHFSLYRYAVSVRNENFADEKMKEYGDVSYAASALLKLKYHDLYCWEEGTRDEANDFEMEVPDHRVVRNRIKKFRAIMGVRMEDWNQLIDSEILSRSASHPTLRMRLDTLGVGMTGVKESVDPDIYRQECEKAAEYVDELIYDQNAAMYEENRKSFYLEPMETVKAWEESGKPIKPEEYADVYAALRLLGRALDADMLCEKAIEELDGAAACFAYYMKGCFLLHTYDASGIDYIYHAMENNSNYIDEGLDMIGEFCCLTGRQEELDVYRQKAVELAQKQKDIYSEVAVLNKKDQLVAEELPEGMLEDILGYIKSIEEGQIQNIYLVRKVITEDFFTSAFVIRFIVDAEMEKQQIIMHRIFSYLDTCADWQFSLFEYSEVTAVKVEKIQNSCVYQKEA